MSTQSHSCLPSKPVKSAFLILVQLDVFTSKFQTLVSLLRPNISVHIQQFSADYYGEMHCNRLDNVPTSYKNNPLHDTPYKHQHLSKDTQSLDCRDFSSPQQGRHFLPAWIQPSPKPTEMFPLRSMRSSWAHRKQQYQSIVSPVMHL